jgi:hypothetical protein
MATTSLFSWGAPDARKTPSLQTSYTLPAFLQQLRRTWGDCAAFGERHVAGNRLVKLNFKFGPEDPEASRATLAVSPAQEGGQLTCASSFCCCWYR